MTAVSLSQVQRKQSGVDADTLEKQLSLQSLVIETGKLPGGDAQRRHFLRVRDTNSAEIALYWEQPPDQRVTTPGGINELADGLTKKLHMGETTPSDAGSVRGSTMGSAMGSAASASSVCSTPR